MNEDARAALETISVYALLEHLCQRYNWKLTYTEDKGYGLEDANAGVALKGTSHDPSQFMAYVLELAIRRTSHDVARAVILAMLKPAV